MADEFDRHPLPMDRVEIVVRGRVQGVGFRFFIQRLAVELGLSGWVCNRADGTVQIVAEGPRSALEELVRAARTGPRGARVTRIDIRWDKPRGDLPELFEIRRTAWW